MVKLTEEQEFRVRAIAIQSESMTTDQIKNQLIEMYTQMIVMESRYKKEIKEKWGIG